MLSLRPQGSLFTGVCIRETALQKAHKTPWQDLQVSQVGCGGCMRAPCLVLPVVFSGSHSPSPSPRPHMADAAGRPDLLSTHQLRAACKVTEQEGGPVLGGTHEILPSCSLAWWPCQMAACPCSVTCHVLWKGRTEMTVNRAFRRESGTHPCHCCCFFMLSTTLGEKKMLLRTTSKWQKV